MKKTIKDAVNQYKGIYPQTDISGRDCVGYCNNYGWVTCFQGYQNLVCTKQQFEDYVRKQKMDKQYKYVPVTGMTIWQLGQAVFEDGEFYDIEGSRLYISRSYELCSERWTQSAIAPMLNNGEITTRQPIPWYEQEGVFPCLVLNENYFFPVVATGFDKESKRLTIQGCNGILVDYCTPLTPEQAAKYGVECD